jgi:hypothetical protein
MISTSQVLSSLKPIHSYFNPNINKPVCILLHYVMLSGAPICTYFNPAQYRRVCLVEKAIGKHFPSNFIPAARITILT